VIIPDNRVTNLQPLILAAICEITGNRKYETTSYWQVVVSMFDTEIRQYVKTGATGSITFLLACKKH